MQNSSNSCGKHTYSTSHDARMAIASTSARVANRIGKKKFGFQKEYYCSDCVGWHLTSMNKEERQMVERQRKAKGN